VGRPAPEATCYESLVVGPFVVVDEAVMDGRHVILDIYEVRGGKVVHQWESGDYAHWVHNAQSD
jgi:hypothetical protein